MKVTDTYVTLVRGVSQQFPQDRRPGQMTEQVNMLPDPVVGLTRRAGSVFQAEAKLNANFTNAQLAVLASGYRRIEYTALGTEYIVLYRYNDKQFSTLPPFIVYNKTSKTFLEYRRPQNDASLDKLEQAGVSAITTVGKYVFAATRAVVPTAESKALWDTPANQTTSVVWLRGGAYARRFELRVRRAGAQDAVLVYTTPSASYPGTLNTSNVPTQIPDHAGGTTTHNEYGAPSAAEGGPVGAAYQVELQHWSLNPTGMSARLGAQSLTNVFPNALTTDTQFSWDPANPRYMYLPESPSYELGEGVTMVYTTVKTIANPDYAKQVNDITSAYNQAVTQWIGTAAAATQPAAIARKFYDLAVAAGLDVTIEDSHLLFSGVLGVDPQDGGDGTLIRVAGTTADNIDDVTLLHVAGHVVKVTPNQGTESFYLKAVPKAPGDTGFTRVQWVEGTATEHTITGGLFYGTASGSAFYVASSPELLNSILPGSHPAFVSSRVGDDDTSPLPSFVNSPITYLGVFQDRLVIGARGVLSFSKSSDYLNFFRQSALTLPADDAFEVLAQGADDDELRYSVLYDRNLVVFGQKRQYAISGRNVLTPLSANMPVMSSHEGAGELPPVAGGSLVFYAKQGVNDVSLWQIAPGDISDSLKSYSASSQLDDYIGGTAVELTAIAKPSMLLVRTTRGLYALTYLDREAERVQDAWHRVEYNEIVGHCCGTSPDADGALMFFLRNAHGSTWVVADYQSMLASPTLSPRLDSLRPYSSLSRGSVRKTSYDWEAAYAMKSSHGLAGDKLREAGPLITLYGEVDLLVGASYPALVEFTSPFVKDRNEKPITIGRLTVTRKLVTMANTSDYYYSINGVRTDVWESNDVGYVQPRDKQVSIVIGKEARSYRLVIGAQSWLPLTITGVEWVGQYFNRAQRP